MWVSPDHQIKRHLNEDVQLFLSDVVAIVSAWVVGQN